MIMKFLFSLFVLCYSTMLLSQPTTFVKELHGVGLTARDILETSDGGYVVAGHRSDTIQLAGYIARINSLGDTLWAKWMPGVQNFVSVDNTVDGCYVVCGQYYNFSSHNYNLMVVKLTSSGTILWQKVSLDSLDETPRQIKQAVDGSIYVLADTYWNSSSNSLDAMVVKLDANGNYLWSKLIGSSGAEIYSACTPAPDGGLFVSCSSNLFAPDISVLLTKINSDGSLSWTKSYPNCSGNSAYGLVATSDNGLALLTSEDSAGITRPGVFRLIKTDSIGNIVWSKVYDGMLGVNLYSLTAIGTGGFLISGCTQIDTGYYSFHPAYAKIDQLGNAQWCRYLGGNIPSYNWNYMQLTRATSDGGLISIGNSETPGLQGFVFLAKSDALGHNGCDSTIAFTDSPLSLAVSAASLNTYTFGNIADTNFVFSFCSDSLSTFCMYVSVDEQQMEPGEITVYPNPSTGKVYFDNLPRDSFIEIVDGCGKKVVEQFQTNKQLEIQLGDFPKGLYLYRITSNSKVLQQGKLIIN